MSYLAVLRAGLKRCLLSFNCDQHEGSGEQVHAADVYVIRLSRERHHCRRAVCSVSDSSGFPSPCNMKVIMIGPPPEIGPIGPFLTRDQRLSEAWTFSLSCLVSVFPHLET